MYIANNFENIKIFQLFNWNMPMPIDLPISP